MIQVQGPDGTLHQFPDGTDDAVIDAAMRRYYGATKPQQAAMAAATQFSAQKRGAWDRFKDDFSDAWNRSWVASGYRAGFDSARDYSFTELTKAKEKGKGESLAGHFNPAYQAGKIVATVEGFMDRGRGGDGATAIGKKSDVQIAAEASRRAVFDTKSKVDPFTKADGLGGKILHGSAALAGTLGAAALDPVSYVSGGRTVLMRALVTGAASAAADVPAQLFDQEVGLQDHYDYSRTLLSFGAGAAFSGAADLVRLKPKRFAEEFFTTPATKAAPVLAVAEQLHAPPMIQSELPRLSLADAGRPEPKPALGDLPGKPLATIGEAPKEAPKAPSGTELVDPSAPKVDAGAGPKADPWANIDWNSAPKARAEAALRHLEDLRKWIKPEMVEAFVKKLFSGADPAAEGVHVNEEFVDWNAMNRDPEGILGWTNALADIFSDVYDHAGDAVKTWNQTTEAAHAFGTSLSKVVNAHANIVKEGGISAQVLALREAALSSDRAFYDQLTRTQEALTRGDFSGVGELAQSVHRTVLMDAMAAGATSEIGRALNAMKIAARPRAVRNDIQALMQEVADAMNAGKPIDPEDLASSLGKLKEAYEKGGSPKMRDELRKMKQLGVSDYVGYVLTGNLLSAFKTHIRNALGTPLHALMQIGERYIAAGIGAARQAVGLGSPERVTFHEALAYSAAWQESLMEAFRVGLKAFARGAPVTDGGSSVLPGHALSQVPFALTKDRMAKWAATGFRPSTVVDVALTGFYETIRTFAYRPSVAFDEAYKVLGRRMQLSALAYREAHYRAQLAPLADRKAVFQATLKAMQDEPTSASVDLARSYFDETGADPNAIFDAGSKAEEMALILQNLDHQAMALDHARLLTFQKAGPVVEAFDKALHMVPIVKYLYVNFVRTPAALLKAGMVDRNPALFWLAKDQREQMVHLTRTLVDADTALQRGGAEADLWLARMTMGSALIAWAWSLHADGKLVGRRGDNGDATRMDGVKPYSIKLPNGEWLQYSPAAPVAQPLGLVADFASAMRERELDDDHGLAMFGALTAGVMNNVTNQTFLSGLSDLMEVLEGKGYGGSDKSRGKQVTDSITSTLVSRVIPLSSLLRSQAQDMDPVVRDARTFLDKIEAQFPLYSETLPAKRDFLGRPLLRGPGERGQLQAFVISKETKDPLDRELSRLGQAIGLRISPADKTFNNGELTAKEYSRVVEVQGQLVRHPITGLNMEQSLRELVQSPEYQGMSDEEKGYRIGKVVTTFRSLGNRAVRDPDSEFYMSEMVRRTGLAKATKEGRKRGLTPWQVEAKARHYGLQPNDPETEQLRALFAD